MKILIESTDQFVSLDGVQARIWNGTTENGTPCLVLVHRIAVATSEDPTWFEAELAEQLPPGCVVDLRSVLP